MADTGTGRILATKVIFPIHGCDRATGGLHEDVGHLDRERIVSAGKDATARHRHANSVHICGLAALQR